MLDFSGPLPNNLKYRVIISTADDEEEDINPRFVGDSIDNIVAVLNMHKSMLLVKDVVRKP